MKSTAPEQARPSRNALAIIYSITFLDLLGFGIILPFLPYYAIELGANGFGLGLLLAAYSLGQLFGGVLLGRLSDRFGRRPILLFSLTGAAIGMVLSGLAGTLVLLCSARALAGLFGGSISAAQAYIADVTAREERAKYMGFLGAAIGLGFVVGPAFGVGLDQLGLGFRGVAFSAAGLAILNLLWAYFQLPEPPRERRQAQKSNLVTDLLHAVRRPDLRRILLATFLTSSAFVSMETTFALLGKKQYGMDEGAFGVILVFIGLVFIAVQGGLIGILTSRFGVPRVALSGDFLMGVTLILLPFMPNLVWAVVVLGALAAAQGLCVPSLSTLASQISDTHEQGAILGLKQSLAATARAVGPLIAGLLYDLHYAAPYLVGGLLALLAGLLLIGLRIPVEPIRASTTAPSG